jgi:class 3 adenylate cyclase/tetratricopeptide (TPR) repeat protein
MIPGGHMSKQPSAERRQITVLHVDIVNSTALVDHLDPEEVMGLMQTYLSNSRAIVNEFHGILAGYTGDGFEAYFGYPLAREESAIDALNAAIRVARMLVEFPFDCRIGIATGRVVVDQPGIRDVGRNALAFGVTPHLATRLEQSANPGHILIDTATMKLCEGRFAFRSMGSIHLKGFDKDYEVWELVEPLHPSQRFIISRLSPYVGRRAEIQLLVSRWQSVLAGEGQVVVLHGEPGIGKSRLVYELQKSLPRNRGTSLQFQCLSQFTSTPLHPWIHSVQRFANFHLSDNADNKREKVTNYLHRKLGLSTEIVAICANLMGLVQADALPAIIHSPQHMARLQTALVEYLISSSQNTPVFLLVEDIQWIDASTMNLLQSLIGMIAKEKIFLVITCRSGNVPSFNYPYVTSLSLTKLDANSILELIARLTSTSHQVLSATITEKICQRSDGNPLFVEELTNHYVELSRSEHLDAVITQPDHLVPNLLQGSLMERIDNAGRSKEIAQLASVIGKEFDSDILVDLSENEPEIVEQQLDDLTELRILHRFSHGGRISYEFCHALLRDAVYSSLLKHTRRRAHYKIAEYFSRGRGAIQNVPSEIVAYHYECADDQDSAFRYWLAAGQHALGTGATEEAANLFAKALKTASLIEETPDNLQDRTIMYLSYGLALNASRGVGADPISYFRKAEELSTRLGNNELTLEALDWQFGLHFNAGELIASRIPAEKMKQLGSSLHHSTAMASGCQGLGMAQFILGNFLEARKEFELGLTAGAELSGAHCYPSMSLSYLAWTLFVLGNSLEAEACADRAIESARQESPHAVATALSNCCYVYQCMNSMEKIYERTEELMEHTRKHGEQIYLRRGIIIRGWADCLTTKSDESIETIMEQIDFLLQSKEEIEVTFLLGVLAELQIRYARYVDAQSSIDRALAIADKNQEKFYLPELYRLKARLAKIDPANFSPARGTDYLIMARELAEAQSAQAWLKRLSA